MSSKRPTPRATSWLLIFRFAILSLSFSVGCLLIEGPTNVRFFELAAQVLPVLLLAFAIEFRFLTPGTRPGTGDLLDVLFLFLVLAWGEWIALDAVAKNGASGSEGTVVGAAILTGFVGVGLGAITANAEPPALPKWAERLRRRRQSRAMSHKSDNA
jgi:hypothetical protein